VAEAGAYRKWRTIGNVRPLRVTLVVVGLALVTYGVSALTSWWLGVPPWVFHEERSYWWLERVPTKGSDVVSALCVLLGLGLAVGAAWPHRSTKVFRIGLAGLGLATVIYGVSTFTGEWLGRPTWWWSIGPPPSTPHDVLVTRYTVVESPFRLLICAIVTGLGLGVTILAAWPWRQKAAPPLRSAP
jgi:hypothetical protein